MGEKQPSWLVVRDGSCHADARPARPGAGRALLGAPARLTQFALRAGDASVAEAVAVGRLAA